MEDAAIYTPRVLKLCPLSVTHGVPKSQEAGLRTRKVFGALRGTISKWGYRGSWIPGFLKPPGAPWKDLGLQTSLCHVEDTASTASGLPLGLRWGLGWPPVCPASVQGLSAQDGHVRWALTFGRCGNSMES